ncbi:putative myb-like dna-binding domain protein [Botrytis fragariae]|uniref:Putative myb-like dna-binding domain protein n=1 Tax=Botrytis fragariae TaxID=1964551 RepID=A0A8H6AQ13_9HELO|nr:putative myb-like dna-binding domain protein [Botrytis fragariae]KAF5871853.1 putative myb-like dna-binding domain protein [Botrytis fragariae]
MESPTERQKMPADSNLVDLEVNDEYSEDYSDTEEDDFIVDDENDDIIYEPGYDPDQELQQKRARLDYKLKSTFESIFEKYGKDFDGVGDEIDLLTGEILVDNGHLKEMQDERDAGSKKAGGSLLRALTAEPECVTETSGDEYSNVEEGDDREEGDNVRDKIVDKDDVAEMSDEDMEEDDIILRGYDEPKQELFLDMASTTETECIRNSTPRNDLQQRQIVQSEGHSISFPSYNEILRSFGPEVAPQIVSLISQKQSHDDTDIEPAWRAPELPSLEPRKRSSLRAFIPEPETERSPSPGISGSIWALPKGRGAKGTPRATHKPTLLSDGLSTSSHAASPRGHNLFTEEEDKTLIAKVAEARDQGLPFATESIWEGLEILNSRHSRVSWKQRYRKKYLHLWSKECSTRPGSRGSYNEKDRETESSIRSASRISHPISSFQRSSRTRKPAQQASTLVSWSDAVATIKFLDRRLHKDLARDASVFDLTDVRPVDVDEDALNLRSSDLESSEESDGQPELPTHIGPKVQRIAPVTVNPAYEFSDEETGSNLEATRHSKGSTTKLKKGARKSSSSKLKGGTSRKPKSSEKKSTTKSVSEEVDELSLGLEGDAVLFLCSLPGKDKQKGSRTTIKREEKQVAVSETNPVAFVPPKKGLSVLKDLDEFDELSAEWPQSLPIASPKKPTLEIKSEPEPEIVDIDVALSDRVNETGIDIFDIDQLPETSPRNALDSRRKHRTNRKFSSSAVIPSTSQVESSPTVAVDERIQSRMQQRRNSVDNGPVPRTSSPTRFSPIPRPKRKFVDLDEKENTPLTPSHHVNQEIETPTFDSEDLALQNMINGNRTPTVSPYKRRGGIITPTRSESRKSRTPLLDYATPTRRDLMRKRELRDSSHSPGMVQTPGGTLRKCGKDGFACQRAFCFRCGLSAKRMGG